MRIALVFALASALCGCKRETDAAFKTEAVSKGSLAETVAATGACRTTCACGAGRGVNGWCRRQ